MTVRLAFKNELRARQAAQYLLSSQRWGCFVTPGKSERIGGYLETKEDWVDEIESIFNDDIIY